MRVKRVITDMQNVLWIVAAIRSPCLKLRNACKNNTLQHIFVCDLSLGEDGDI